jgi:hypothetical protein
MELFSMLSDPRLYKRKIQREEMTIDLLLLTDSDKRQTHPLVREGATPKDKTEIVKK